MATSRSYRLGRIERELELGESARRRAYNELALAAALVERTAPGIAPIEPAALMAMFASAPAQAWAALASLTRPQLVNQAMETAVWLETTGVMATWASVLARWETRLAELATQQAA